MKKYKQFPKPEEKKLYTKAQIWQGNRKIEIASKQNPQQKQKILRNHRQFVGTKTTTERKPSIEKWTEKLKWHTWIGDKTRRRRNERREIRTAFSCRVPRLLWVIGILSSRCNFFFLVFFQSCDLFFAIAVNWELVFNYEKRERNQRLKSKKF